MADTRLVLALEYLEKLEDRVKALEVQLRCYHTFERINGANACKHCGLDKPLPEDVLS